ncbi:CoA transferase [Streptomyces sparsogenes]|uniref:CaiB/BaiF CoA transferase family protein n=1 Tax=Streptomyces sparsogenes TaxID=67365 RepID=UPI0033FB12E3
MTQTLLEGVRVLDMTNVLSGPFAGYQLALMGADVIKLEVPKTGDLARQLGADPELSSQNLGVSFLAQNAGKRSVTLNLKQEQGKEVFSRLVAQADVLLENFRPGVLERLGFGWDRLREINPRLVYCALSGFGSDGPMRQRPAYDQIIQGLSGTMSITGAPDTAPLRVGYPICDSIGGIVAAFSVASALLRQHRTGQGARLDVSMLDATLASMGWIVSDYLIAGREPAPMGNENRTSAPSGTFDTADGQLNIAANKQEQFEALCTVLDRQELISDPRFISREARKDNRDTLRKELEKTLRKRPAEHWDAVLVPAGVPAAPVLSVPQALSLPQVQHRRLTHRVSAPALDGRELTLLGSAAHVDGASIAPPGPPPRLGEHTDEILEALGYTPDDITRLRENGAV